MGATIALTAALLAAASAVAPDEGLATVTGVVQEAGGRPIADVRLTWMGSLDGTVDGFRAPIPRDGDTYWIRSDARGRFVLRAPRGHVTIVAARSGQAITIRLIPVELGEDGAKVLVRFDGTGSIQGRAVDEAGRPLPRVRITILPERTGTATGAGDGTVVRGWTGDDGAFSLGGLGPGAYRLLARGPGYECTEACEHGQGMRVRTGVAARVTVPLGPVGSVSGRVLRRDASGELWPVRRFLVSSRAFHGTEVTSEDGFFEIDVPRLWVKAPLFVFAEGLAPFATRFDLETPLALDLGDIVLGSGRVVRGHVRDGASAPVEGATVAVGYSSFDFREGAAVTDAEGAFELRGVQDGDAPLTVSHPAFHALDLVAAPGTPSLDVRLARGLALLVRVVDADGTPLGGARVWSVLSKVQCRTDQDGRCPLTGLEPREEVLEVRLPGTARPTPRQLRVPAALLPGAVTIRLARKPATLKVVVVEPGGTFASAEVVAIPGEIAPERLGSTASDLAVAHYATGIDLEKRIDNLPPGRYTIVARALAGRRCAAPVVDLPEGDQRVTVTLPADQGPCRR